MSLQEHRYDVDIRLAAAVNTADEMLQWLSQAAVKTDPSSESPPPPPPIIPGEVVRSAEMRYTFVVGEGETSVPPQSESRRQLLAKKSAGQADEYVRTTYMDYTKHDEWALGPVTRGDPAARMPSESQARLVGLKRNRLVGGLLLHTRREVEAESSVCTARFQQLARSCFRGQMVDSFGIDTVFNPGSALFRPDLQDEVGWYYNTTPGSAMLNEHTLSPKPFALRPLLDRAPGVPLVIDTGLGARRAQELYTFIQDGAYIGEYTTHIEATMATWNAQRQTMGFLQLDWTRLRKGIWQVQYEVAALPVTYWGVSSLRSALWLLLHVLWIAVSIMVFAKEMARLTPRALEATHKQDAYLLNLMSHFSGYGNILAVCGACMQLTVLGLFFTYHYSMLHVVELSLRYHVYDDLHADANFFLSAREAEPSSFKGPDAAGLVEASAPAWTRPEDNSGLEEYAAKLQMVQQLGFLYQLFFMLQAGRSLIMMLRILNATTGQKRLAVVSKTLVTSFFEVIQCVPFFVSLACFAVMFNIEMGHRLAFFSTLSETFRVLGFFAFLGDYKSVKDEAWEDSAFQRFKETTYITLFVAMYMFFLGNFVLAIVCDSMCGTPKPNPDVGSVC
ncbi:hypothetical protein CYMTET_46029 [Cymbomonas tetramitiformis]|uniref:Polycystin cation channel PKD1/PKD2 domain-containing protein n=1 Tax=Cymbomonas tetramitiformis TaxID=36881 RepID=A0AAE0BX08_9CHLO|nr:hypothetical protein CYMTET_46029 [Cymbomonas tetramitiformis]